MWGSYTRVCYGAFSDRGGGGGGVGFAPLYNSKVIDVWLRWSIRHLASLDLKYIHARYSKPRRMSGNQDCKDNSIEKKSLLLYLYKNTSKLLTNLKLRKRKPKNPPTTRHGYFKSTFPLHATLSTIEYITPILTS